MSTSKSFSLCSFFFLPYIYNQNHYILCFSSLYILYLVIFYISFFKKKFFFPYIRDILTIVLLLLITLRLLANKFILLFIVLHSLIFHFLSHFKLCFCPNSISYSHYFIFIHKITTLFFN